MDPNPMAKSEKPAKIDEFEQLNLEMPEDLKEFVGAEVFIFSC
jgi:hypothetical protein